MNVTFERLERVANMAIIVAAVCCACAWTWYATQTRVTAAPSVRYSAGDSLADVRELDGSAGRPTLLFLVSSTCRFCNESMPFYRTLLADEATAGWRIVFASREHLEDLRDYLAQHELPLQKMSLVRLGRTSAFKANATPSLFLLDGNRRIVHSTTGRLNTTEQAALRAALSDRPRSGPSAG
jgi:hypothetical protein